MAGKVIVLHDAFARMLSRELGVSEAFVRSCRDLGVTVAQAKAILSWFLTRPRSERVVVMKALVREMRITKAPRKE